MWYDVGLLQPFHFITAWGMSFRFQCCPGGVLGEHIYFFGVTLPFLSWRGVPVFTVATEYVVRMHLGCLLYTSDAADDWLVV